LLWHQTILEQHGALKIGFNDAGYVRKLFMQFFGFDASPAFFYVLLSRSLEWILKECGVSLTFEFVPLNVYVIGSRD